MRVKLLLKSAWLRLLEGWLAPAVFPETLSAVRVSELQGGRWSPETEGAGEERLLQDLKFPGTLILVVQRIHGVVGEFPGACGILKFQAVHGAVGAVALA